MAAGVIEGLVESVDHEPGPLTLALQDGVRTCVGAGTLACRRENSPLGDHVVWRPGEDGTHGNAEAVASTLRQLPHVEQATPVGRRVFLRVSDEAIDEHILRIGHRVAPFPAKGPQARIALLYANPNTNKPLHLGHLRQIALGGSLVRLFQAAGYETVGCSLISDWGIHIAEAIVGYSEVRAERNGSAPERSAGAHLVGSCLAAYHRARTEDEARLEASARDVLRRLHGGDGELLKLNEQLTGWVVAGHAATYEALRIRHHFEVFESDELPRAFEMIERGCRQGALEVRSDGSIGVDLTSWGLWDVTLVRPDGTTTVYAQHAGGLDRFFRELEPDVGICLLGPDFIPPGNAERVIYERLGLPWAGRYVHVRHGLVSSSAGRLRSRFGVALTIDAVLEQVQERLTASSILPESAYEALATEEVRDIAASLLKYAFLRTPRNTDSVFDEGELWGSVAPRFASMMRARDIARERCGTSNGRRGTHLDGDERNRVTPAVRALALAVNDLPVAAHRSLRRLDPVFLVRHLDTLTTASLVAAKQGEQTDALWASVVAGFETTLHLLDLAMP